MRIRPALVVSLLCAWASTEAQQNTALEGPVVATIQSSEIAGFDNDPPEIKKLLENALALTRRNLGYLYGSADPSQPGMDCSGTVYYLLGEQGLKDVPRSSDEQYVWVRKAGTFRAVQSSKMDSFEFNELKPGDLLFWEGTYAVKRDIPVSHSMIYLGKAKADGMPLMVGASDGRSYRGQKCYGVSVFEFKLPKEDSKSKFIGYAKVPGLSATGNDKAQATDATVESEKPAPSSKGSTQAAESDDEPAPKKSYHSKSSTKKKPGQTND